MNNTQQAASHEDNAKMMQAIYEKHKAAGLMQYPERIFKMMNEYADFICQPQAPAPAPDAVEAKGDVCKFIKAAAQRPTPDEIYLCLVHRPAPYNDTIKAVLLFDGNEYVSVDHDYYSPDIVEWLDESGHAEGQKGIGAKEIIEDLLEAIPKQTEDADWWDSDLVQAVEKAKKFIG